MQDINFISQTIKTMTESVSHTETLHKIIGTANQYATTMKFPLDKTQWSDEQLDKYFSMIEKLVEMPVEYTQADFDSMSIQEKLEAAGIQTEDKSDGVQQAGDMLGGIVEKMEQQNYIRREQ